MKFAMLEAMSAGTQVALEEYLKTVYRPDCDFVDGELEERNVGELNHGYLTSLLSWYFFQHQNEFHIVPISDWRTRVSGTRYRVPDLTLMRETFEPEPVLSKPPYVCIEILSPEDRWSRMYYRLNDFLAAGAENVWVIDPVERAAWTHDAQGTHPVHDLVLVTSDGNVRLPLQEIFAKLP